jgi:hypothetical protein
LKWTLTAHLHKHLEASPPQKQFSSKAESQWVSCGHESGRSQLPVPCPASSCRWRHSPGHYPECRRPPALHHRSDGRAPHIHSAMPVASSGTNFDVVTLFVFGHAVGSLSCLPWPATFGTILTGSGYLGLGGSFATLTATLAADCSKIVAYQFGNVSHRASV